MPTVRTEHTLITLLDFYKRGIQDFEIAPLYKKELAEINNIEETSPDKILENSYDYWALSEFANLLKLPEDQKVLRNESQEYRSTWIKYFSKMNENSDVMHGDGLYEGTIWQYRWHVQFDIRGLIELIGGRDSLAKELEYFFENNLYNHGNQPDLHAPFLFNYSSKPWLTQKWVNRILTKEMTQYYGTHEKWEEPYIGKIYKTDPKGFIPEMDDDEGTMSSWFVLASLGLYPVEVGKPEFQITTPIFRKVTINLNNGKKLEIGAPDINENNFYIQEVFLNGNKLKSTSVNHSNLKDGSKIKFILSSVPNPKWGTGK